MEDRREREKERFRLAGEAFMFLLVTHKDDNALWAGATISETLFAMCDLALKFTDSQMAKGIKEFSVADFNVFLKDFVE